MNLKQVSFWRNRAGWAGTVFCILLFLAVLDSLVARFREPSDHFSVLPNEEIAVTAPLIDQTDTLADLLYKSSIGGIILRFENLQTGYWLGGAMWNGTLSIDSTVSPGSYTVSVQNRKGTPNKNGPLFYIDVYRNSAELKRHSPSFFIRLFGVTSWGAALFFFPWVVLSFGAVFYLSGIRERLLIQEGKAEIYRVKTVENEVEIFFPMGREQGLRPGVSVTLIDPKGIEVGTINVHEVFEEYSTARVDQNRKIIPGFWVSR
jgi:hypothetical protein